MVTATRDNTTQQSGILRDQLRDELVYRAWKDESFRQELLANPAAVLQREYSEAFPDGNVPTDLTIKVVEEEKNTLCIVLPQKPDLLAQLGLWNKPSTHAASCGCWDTSTTSGCY